MIFTVLWLLYDTLSLKADVNVPTVHKKYAKNLFCWYLEIYIWLKWIQIIWIPPRIRPDRQVLDAEPNKRCQSERIRIHNTAIFNIALFIPTFQWDPDIFWAGPSSQERAQPWTPGECSTGQTSPWGVSSNYEDSYPHKSAFISFRWIRPRAPLT